MAAGGDHQVGRPQAAAGVEHQPGHLFAQGQVTVDVVVVQARHVLASAQLGKAAQQRLQGRAVDVGHAAAELHHILARRTAHQLQHVFPLRDVHRALGRAANCGQCRQLPLVADEVAGLGPRRDQAAVFEHAIGLLHGAQADPMLLTQCAHGRQALAGAIEPLLDAGAEYFGEIQVEGHGILLRCIGIVTGTVAPKIQHSVGQRPILYGNNKAVLDLYCRGCRRACFLHGNH
ncbi:hypothetical protein D9M71_374420 [compost metagenome]